MIIDVKAVLILIRNSSEYLEGLLIEAVSFGAFDLQVHFFMLLFHLWRGHHLGSDVVRHV